MRVKILTASAIAAVFAGGLTLSAQQQPPTQQPPAPTADQAQPASFKLVGCVNKETDVLKRAMTSSMPGNPGLGDEFVLTHAVIKSDGAMEKPETEAPAGTSGTESRFGRVYRATGEKESELKTYVGQRVAITGTFKNDDDATRELRPTGTSGRPPAAEPTVANSPEITILSIAPMAGSCSPVK